MRVGQESREQEQMEELEDKGTDPHSYLNSEQDDDLHFTKNIELVEALTNEEIAFHHLDSREIKCTWDYNVVFSPGSVIRLRGQGMPILGKFGEFGDLFAHLQVIFPSEVSDEQKVCKTGFF